MTERGDTPAICANRHGLPAGSSLRSHPMTTIKYYTHFLLQERLAQGLNEFRGVVEVNRMLPRGDMREAAAVLARNFECDSRDIKVLQWSRLH